MFVRSSEKVNGVRKHAEIRVGGGSVALRRLSIPN